MARKAEIKSMVMVDLETLDTTPDAAVASIGAQAFTVEGMCGDSVEWVVDLPEQDRLGRRIGAGTVRWWMQQSDAARAVFQAPTLAVADALAGFTRYVGDVAGDRKTAVLWGNGADFDLVILRSLYDSAGIVPPWEFYNNRCFRTLKNLMRKTYKATQPVPTGLVKHSAKDDARGQALVAAQLLRVLPE